jgi:hypothetical protein
MPVLNSMADVITRKLPKVVSSDAHLAADYIVAGSFLAAGTWFRLRQNRRAALAAWICGGSTLGLALLTSYPGHPTRPIPFRFHGRIETGLAAMIATMPEFLRFENDRERRYFLLKAGVLTVLSNLSSFAPRHSERIRLRRAS